MKKIIKLIIVAIIITVLIIINSVNKTRQRCITNAKNLNCEYSYSITEGCNLKCKPTGSLILDAMIRSIK